MWKAQKARFPHFHRTAATTAIFLNTTFLLLPPAETLRRWQRAEGLGGPRRKRRGYRKRRERKGHFGEMVQLDASFHRWLEERGERGCLMHMIDDATGRIELQFSEGETT
jgi:hypothetical protein